MPAGASVCYPSDAGKVARARNLRLRAPIISTWVFGRRVGEQDRADGRLRLRGWQVCGMVMCAARSNMPCDHAESGGPSPNTDELLVCKRGTLSTAMCQSHTEIDDPAKSHPQAWGSEKRAESRPVSPISKHREGKRASSKRKCVYKRHSSTTMVSQKSRESNVKRQSNLKLRQVTTPCP